MAAREARASSRNPLDHAAVPRFHLGDNGVRLLIVVIIGLAAPVFGLVIACVFAWQLHNDGQMAWRNAMLGLAGAAALAMTLAISPLFLIHALLH